MIWRLLLWVALVGLGWWALRQRGTDRRAGADLGGQPRRGSLRPPEAMVDCARCGVHLPASEAVRDRAGRPYCCAEHRDAGARPGP